jgi:opacity protein-like surface antigen
MYRTLVTAVIALACASAAFAADAHKSGPFAGAKANTGYVTHSTEGGKSILTLSEDFKPPGTPDPHWAVIDSDGTMYLLDRIPLKGDKEQRRIEVPAYVKDIKTVRIWCAWAEANLGEASFDQPVK